MPRKYTIGEELISGDGKTFLKVEDVSYSCKQPFCRLLVKYSKQAEYDHRYIFFFTDFLDEFFFRCSPPSLEWE